MRGIGRYLNRQLEVWRPSTVDDGAGGQQTTLAQKGTVAAKVDQPSPTERFIAQQFSSRHTHNIYTLPSADVLRGDELRGDGQAFRVESVVQPSRSVYSKAFVELIQKETD